MNNLKRTALNFVFVLLSLAVNAQSKTTSGKILPFDSAVRTGKLANGFTYFIRYNKEPKDRMIFYLANKVGSILEDDDQRGLAHFMEHMSFNGTKHFPKNELINYLQKAGVRFGADINAYTNFDETVYQLPLPSDDPAIITNGIEIMHDWAHGATLDPADIDKERGVVLEEKRLGKGVGEHMQAKYLPSMVNYSRYADRLPIGTDDVLNNFKPETIKRFYHDWYRPDLQALIVVGDIDVDKMEKMIRQKFADLKGPEKEKPRVKYKVPFTGKNQFTVVTDPEMTTTTAEVLMKQPELALHTGGDFRAFIIRTLYNTMLSLRYSELMRQTDPPFLSGSASIGAFMGGLDAYGLTVTAKPGELERGFKAVWRESEKAKRFGFSTSELTRAKAVYLNQVTSALKEKDKTPSTNYVHEYLSYFLNGTAASGIDHEARFVQATLPNISMAELNEFARSVIKNTDRDIVILAPEKDRPALPTKETVNQWITGVQQEKMETYKDVVNNSSLLARQPVGGKIISESYDNKLGIIDLKLSNGIKVLLKPTNYKNDEISFTAFSPGGTSLYSDADAQSANAANLVPSYGAGNYNAIDLAKLFSDKQLSVNVSVGECTQNINGATTNKDMGAAFELLYAYLIEPRKDTVLFNSIMSRSKASLVDRFKDPGSIFQDTVSAVLSGHNPRRTGPSVEKLDQIDLGKSYQVYKERFADASGTVFVFVGSIDTASIKPLIAKYIGGLPASGKITPARDLNIYTPPGIIERIVHKGTEPKATVELVFSGDYDHSVSNNIKMDALKEVLQIRMIERLREEESGVYSPGVSIRTTKLPKPRFSMTISFGCAPQNVDKLIASALDEIEMVKTTGPSQTNIDKFKAEDRRGLETALKTNDFWLTYLSGQLQNGENPDQVFGYNDTLLSITTNDVRSVAAKYLTGRNYIKLVLMPEK